jgi:hypothetical protein
MRQAARRIVASSGALVVAALLGLTPGGAGWTAEVTPAPDLAQSLKATSSASQPLNLLLTQAELRSVVRNYEIRTGEDHTAPISDEEILVKAPGMVAPMRDPSQDVGFGIFAPFWAIAHPKDAWRIFVPIPLKGPARESERPAPDPR